MMFSLDGKVAVVTGGNGGIGLGMANALAEAGAKVVIIGRNAEKTGAAGQGLRDKGHDVLDIVADISSEAQAQKAIDDAAAHFGRLDILVNNAGSFVYETAAGATLESWNGQIANNLTCAFICARAAYPHLVAAGGGKVINVGSLASVRGQSHGAAYTAAKGGILQLSQALAVEWGPQNIQVNCVLPGFTDTDLSAIATDELRVQVSRRTPARRWATPDDFKGIAVFLASAASDFITGTAIAVDGGYSVQMF